jgi:hypothetical protein
MAIQQISNGEAGASVRGKLNSALGGAAATLFVDDTTTVAALNAWLASDIGRHRKIVGEMDVDEPIIIPSNRYLDLTEATFTALAGWTEDNLFQNAAVAAVQTLTGVSMTAGSNVVTGTGFTVDLDGKQVAVSGTGISAYSGRAPTYGTFEYVSATSGNILPVVAASSTSACNAIVSASGQTMSVFERDSDITIIGGVIDRRPLPTQGSDGNIKHVMLLRRIDGLVIEGTEVLSDNAKYCWSIADVSHVRIADLSFPEASSDGLHFIGPVYDVRVKNIRGATEDDLVSFTAADFSPYSDTSGDMLNVRVRDITSEGAVTAFKCITGTGIKVADFEVDGIHGVTTTRCVAIIDDYTGATDVAIKLRNLTVKTTSTSAPQVDLMASLARVIEIDGLDLHPTTGRTATSLPMVHVGAAIEHLKIGRVRVPEPPANGVGWCAIDVNISGGGTVGCISLRDWKGKFAVSGNSPAVIFIHTTLTDLIVEDFKVENIAALAYGDVASALRLFTSNVELRNANFCVDWRDNLTWLYASTLVDTFGNYLRYRGPSGKSLLMQGASLSGAQTPTNSQISLSGSSGTPNFRIRDDAFPVDLSILQKNNGDKAWNTNAALACGVGPAVSDGTNWKNLFSGATY